MNNIKIIERINKLIDNMNYKEAYIEIKTGEDKIIIEKNKRNPIGFSKERE